MDTTYFKTCTQCGETKPASAFHTRRASKDGYMASCRICRNAYLKQWREAKIDEQRAKERVRGRKRYRANREKVIAHYGGKCACCGEATYEFLHVDHINGDGGYHRRTEAPASEIIRWLIRNDFPDGFRVLCANCNMAIGAWGQCPHQT